MKNINSIFTFWKKATDKFTEKKRSSIPNEKIEKSKKKIKLELTTMKQLVKMGVDQEPGTGKFLAERDEVTIDLKKYKKLIDKEAAKNSSDTAYTPYQKSLKILFNVLRKLDPKTVTDKVEEEPNLETVLANASADLLQEIPDDGSDDNDGAKAPSSSEKRAAATLTSELEDFERRKDKIMVQLAKLPYDDERRSKLTEKIRSAESKGRSEGTFKGAYADLDKIKSDAYAATAGIKQPLADKIRDQIARLAKTGKDLTESRRVIRTRLNKLEQSLTQKFPRKGSAISDPTQLQQFKQGFREFETLARATLLAAKKENDDGAADLAKIQLPKQLAALAVDLDALQNEDAGAWPKLVAEMNLAKAEFEVHGKLLTPVVFQTDYALLAKTILDKIADWKKGVFDLAGEKAPPLFAPLEAQEAKRRADVKAEANKNKAEQQAAIDKSQDPVLPVRKVYDWKASAQYQPIKKAYPQNPAKLNAIQVKQAAANVAKEIKTALTGAHPNSDLAFDLSLQTPSRLLNTLIAESYQPTDPPKKFVDQRDQLEGDSTIPKNNAYLQALWAYTGLKAGVKKTGDYAVYLDELRNIEADLQKKAGDDKFKSKFPQLVPGLTALLQEVTREKAAAEPLIQNLQIVADEMHKAILETCPNKASKETESMDIGDGKSVEIPKKLTLNNVDFSNPKYLAKGGLGAVSMYKDANGNSVVVKTLIADKEDPAKQAQIEKELYEEMKVHRHVLGGENGQGHENVVDLKGVLRGPDGSMHIVLEHADGGNMQEYSQSLRELSKSGVLSAETQNALSQDTLRQMVLGLAHVQGQNVAHLDVKDLNCFMTADGQLKLGDFGTSRVGTDAAGTVGTPPETTPKYRAPEVEKRKDDTSVKGDNYAVGAVMATFMSPTDRQDVAKFNEDFKASKARTTLEQLQYALLNDDPAKRPSLQVVQESLFLNDVDTHDPRLMKNLKKAAIAYSRKVGKEVGAHQEQINLNLGKIKSADEVAADDDAGIQKTIHYNQQTIAEHGPVKLVHDRIGSVSLRVEESKKELASTSGEHQRKGFDLLKSALSEALNAQKLYQTLKINDPGLSRTIEGLIAVARQELDKAKQLFHNKNVELQGKIDAINDRDDVKPLLDAVRQADEELRRGSGNELDIKNIKARNQMLKANLPRLAQRLGSDVGGKLKGIHAKLEALEKDIDQLTTKPNKDAKDEAALRQKTEESKKLQDAFEGEAIQKALPSLARSIGNSRLPAEVQAKLVELAKAAAAEFKAGKITQASLLVNRIQAQIERKAAADRPSEQDLQAEIARRQARQKNSKGEDKNEPYQESGEALVGELKKLKGKLNAFLGNHPDQKNAVLALIQQIRRQAFAGSLGMAKDLLKQLKEMLAEKPEAATV